MWDACLIRENPLLLCYDGATLSLDGIDNRVNVKNLNFYRTNAFGGSLCVETNDYRYKKLFFLVFEQRNIVAYDEGMNQIKQISFDAKMAVIALRWVRELNNLYLSGTNGWIKCFHLETQHLVSGFDAHWDLVFEIKSTEDWVTSLSHDFRHKFIYGTADMTLYVWDLNSGEFLFRLPNLHDQYKLCQVDVFPESSVVITSGLDGYLKIWSIHLSACKLYSVICAAPAGFLSFCIFNRSIITVGSDRIMKHFLIGDSEPQCALHLCEKRDMNYENVVKYSIRVVPMIDGSKGHYCITSFNEIITIIMLGTISQDYLKTIFPIKTLCFSKEMDCLICSCERNIIITYSEDGISETLDLDIISVGENMRTPVSEVISMNCSGNQIFFGLLNGGLKCYNQKTRQTIMKDDASIDDSINHLTMVKGVFNPNHQYCDSMKCLTDDDHEYIIGYSRSGSVYIWCSKCYTCVVDQKIGKKETTDICFLHSNRMLFLASKNTIWVYSFSSHSFKPTGRALTSGNQIITTIDVSSKYLLLFAGTNSSELLVFSIEDSSEENNSNFNLLNSFFLDIEEFTTIYCIDSQDCILISMIDGTIIALDQKTGDILTKVQITDECALTSSIFSDHNGSLIAYLSFGEHVHKVPIPIERENNVIEIYKEEEDIQDTRIVQEEIVDDSHSDIQCLSEANDSIAKILKDFEEEKRQKRIKKKKKIIEDSNSDEIIEKPIEKPKMTLEQVIEKNQMKVEEIFLATAPHSTAIPLKKEKKSKSKFDISIEEDNETFSMIVSGNRKINHLHCFDYSSLRSRPKTVIEEAKPLINVKISEKALVFGDDGNYSISTSLHQAKKACDFETRDALYMIPKIPKIAKKSPPMITKAFICPPPSMRVLFDDPECLNALSFCDPQSLEKNKKKKEVVNNDFISRPVSSQSTNTKRTYHKYESISQKNQDGMVNDKKTISFVSSNIKVKPKNIKKIEEHLDYQTEERKDNETEITNLNQHEKTNANQISQKLQYATLKKDDKPKIRQSNPQLKNSPEIIKDDVGSDKQSIKVKPPVLSENRIDSKENNTTNTKIGDSLNIDHEIMKVSKTNMDQSSEVSTEIHTEKDLYSKPRIIQNIDMKTTPPADLKETLVPIVEIDLSLHTKAKQKKVVKNQPFVPKNLKSEYSSQKKTKTPENPKRVEISNKNMNKELHIRNKKKHKENDTVKNSMKSPKLAPPKQPNVQTTKNSIPNVLSPRDSIDDQIKTIVPSNETSKTIPVNSEIVDSNKDSQKTNHIHESPAKPKKHDINQKAEIPIIRKQVKRFENDIDLSFGGGFSSSSRQSESDELPFSYLSNLSVFWNQNHIYPICPILILDTKYVKDTVFDINDLDKQYPTISQNIFAPHNKSQKQDMLDQFNEIFDHHTLNKSRPLKDNVLDFTTIPKSKSRTRKNSI